MYCNIYGRRYNKNQLIHQTSDVTRGNAARQMEKRQKRQAAQGKQQIITIQRRK